MKNNEELCIKYWKNVEKSLTKKEIECMKIKYGILDGKIKSREETAKICNVSYSRIGWIERKFWSRIEIFLSMEKDLKIQIGNKSRGCRNKVEY